MARARLRDLGFAIGRMPTGKFNAITDVPGTLVGHTTLIHDDPRIARTGVTVVVPREDETWKDAAFSGCFSFNGSGEMTGIPWIEESGMLTSIIGITNTHQVGLVRDALVEHAVDNGYIRGWVLPVVAETYDGFLNDIDAFHLKKEHVFQAIASASSGVPDEGNAGGGTGMLCHGFKGGIGTSSRVVGTRSGQFTVGALVQANYGARADLRVNGVPVGLEIGPEAIPLPGNTGSRRRLHHHHRRYGCTPAPHPVPATGEAGHSRFVQSRGIGAQRQRRHLPGILHRQSRPSDRQTSRRQDAPPGPHQPAVRRDRGGRGRVDHKRPDLCRNHDRPRRPHGPRPPS